MFLFPVFTHYNIPLKQVYQYALYIGAAYPHYALGISVAWLVMMFTSLYTGFIFFFFASLSAFIIMYG
ncbi:hypothetical protein, partial [Pseudomonas sp. 2995-1]|uniref:hypothetical protein n=1 Tax=Pseudomonas sp. 2995-1 TaxID=1712679 RepID=UPI001C48D2E2